MKPRTCQHTQWDAYSSERDQRCNICRELAAFRAFRDEVIAKMDEWEPGRDLPPCPSIYVEIRKALARLDSGEEG